ncbi:MAG: TolC family protein [Spirochaetaceae bacterium]|jgi:outer membrane protein TolC|nr:TolC family protein [Spirochaetaceae bacterium]
MIAGRYGRAVLFGAEVRAGVSKKGALLALCAGLAWLGFAQEPEAGAARRLSPDEAVDLALKSNLTLESARITAGMKRRKADTAWNVLVPSLDISAAATGSLYKAEPASPLAPAPVQWRFIPLSASASLSLNAALFEGMRNLRLDYEAGIIALDKAKSQLERDVRKAYYNMLLIQENIALLRESLAAAERRLETARANYRAGLAPELTMLQAQVAMENMKPTIDQTENGFKLSMAQFAMNLGLPYDTRFELIPLEQVPAFAPLEVKELISAASRNKPDIMELKQSILLLESQRKATFYKIFTPSLTLSLSMHPTLWDNVSGWYAVDDAWKTQQSSWTFSLGFRLNGLFPFGSERQGLRDIDDNLRLLHVGLAQAVRGTEIEIYSAILNLEKARITAEAQGRTVDLAERTYRLTETAYRAGLQDLLEVQNAELELRRARIGILEQNFTYLQGLIDLEYAVGVPFGTLSGGIR